MLKPRARIWLNNRTPCKQTTLILFSSLHPTTYIVCPSCIAADIHPSPLCLDLWAHSAAAFPLHRLPLVEEQIAGSRQQRRWQQRGFCQDGRGHRVSLMRVSLSQGWISKQEETLNLPSVWVNFSGRRQTEGEQDDALRKLLHFFCYCRLNWKGFNSTFETPPYWSIVILPAKKKCFESKHILDYKN